MHKKESMSLYLQSPRLNQMNILREVAADAHITQAELAARCSLSVAMVNNYMKELCRVGLMEYHRRTIKSVTYHLTLAGAERLEMLQQELMRDMVGMFVASKEQILARILSHELLPAHSPRNRGKADIGLAPAGLEPQNLQVFGDV